jgi:acetylornithine/N-succinyldiaminopimelate aminotransferase
MNLFDVYPLFDITPVRAEGSYLWDKKGDKYLDLYGGHAVISIGHTHPHYVQRLSEQLQGIGFYSNSVQIPLQQQLADKLGRLSGYDDYALFLCNSGAEANENALKAASFHNKRKKVITFSNAFHGRTSGTVALTDNPKIIAPFNSLHDVITLPFNDAAAFHTVISDEVAAVIIEGIQGVGGIRIPDPSFLQLVAERCKEHGALLILDEVQSGYGRTGKFFAHQYAGIRPDLITIAKGMGNGFPVGAVLISPEIKAWSGMLGTTFGGNYLACAAAIAVLEVIEEENLVDNAAYTGAYLLEELRKTEGIKAVRGEGLMIGIDLPGAPGAIRKSLLEKHRMFTGEAKPDTLRLLPSLTLKRQEADLFLAALKEELALFR